jgi:hypothetical protein
MGATEDDYKKSFGIGAPDSGKTEKALDHALDIRKFEIGLYWQRAAYFWALITVAFAGYFAILSAEHLADKEFLAYVVSCIGWLFTWAWFLVNRGSKQWQENWENHVDMLEDSVVGPLYKTTLLRPNKGQDLSDTFVTGPAPFSVSKINQWVSFFTLIVWLCLIIHSFPGLIAADCGGLLRNIFVPVLTVVFAVLMWFRGRTDLGGERMLAMRKRRTGIGD